MLSPNATGASFQHRLAGFAAGPLGGCRANLTLPIREGLPTIQELARPLNTRAFFRTYPGLDERFGLFSLTESVAITHRTSGDSDACPPTCYWVFGIGAPEAVH